MEFFVTQTIKRIRGLSSYKHKELREACDATTKAIEENKGKLVDGAKEDTDADKYFRPFQLACATNNAKMMSAALDCTQKLIAYGYLTGATNVTDPKTPGKTRKLMDVVIETICACNSHTDENVQLQVIKALLTAVVTPHCEMHETSLLLAVRACYHIHLVSRNSVNRTTAKGTLKQMLNICFQKMETFDQKQAKADSAHEYGEAASTIPGLSLAVAKDDNGKEEDLPLSPSPTRPLTPAEQLKKRRMTLWEQDPEYNTSIAWRAGPNMYPNCYISLGYTSVGHDMADLDLYEDLNPSERVPKNPLDSSEISGDFVQPSGQSPNDPFRSLYHKDAFLLLRSLCKLSMKQKAQEGMEQADPVALQTKLLSLELIRGVLESAGPSFRKGTKFVYAVKQYLCESLIKNCVSSNTRVVNLSLHIFVALINHFRDYLRSEIEVFVSTIFLRILEEETSDLQHRLLVLEVFYKLCQDGQTIVELFINYDCGMGVLENADDTAADTEQGLFERIVHVLSDTAQVDCSGDPEKMSVRHRKKLRMLALQSVVALSKCLVDITALPDLPEEEMGDTTNTPIRGARAGSVTGSPGDGISNTADQANAVTLAERTSVADAVESFDKKQRIKRELETGILKFNAKPKTGIIYLLENGHLERAVVEEGGEPPKKLEETATPESVAKFLLRYADAKSGKTSLDKTVIGDYLGEGKDFNILVLHRYVDLLHFTGMEVDEAIRQFLQGFRLPGEAQKIDRMMEKFGERYCELNEGVFPSADTCFVLSYSIIMLQTDLHNPNIKAEKKMKKEEYLRNNRGIANGSDLPKAFLGGIYDRIKATPITLKDDDKRMAKDPSLRRRGGNPSGVNRRVAARRLQEDIERQAVDRMKRRPSMSRALRHGDNSMGADAFVTIEQMSLSTKDHVRPMFTVLWGPLIAVYNLLLETGDSEEIVRLCLEGIQYGVRIAGVFGMHEERHSYMKTIANYTDLESGSLLDMKNIECLRLLLKMALEEGEHLRQSWEQVLNAMSLMRRLELLAKSPQLGDDQFFTSASKDGDTDDDKPRSSSSGLFFLGGYTAAAMAAKAEQRRRSEALLHYREVEQTNAINLVEFVELKNIERVFNLSVHFSEEAIVSFVTCLCDVARTELLGPEDEEKRKEAVKLRGPNANQPRVFCLQKLVEVASYNMETRTRLVWSQLWRHLSNLFTEVGVHENPSVAMYAIDSLKQLGMKFLEKAELSHFNFQSIFLIPFERIMSKSQNLEIKELVVGVIDNITQARVENIMSGWRAIFCVYTNAGSDTVESLNLLGFEAVERVFISYFHYAKDSFVDLVNCYAAFAKNPIFLKTSCNAIRRIAECATKLAEDRVKNAAKNAEFVFTDSKSDTGAWWPILTNLAHLVMDRREPVRTLSLESLFATLAEHGHLFSTGLWELVFKGVLFPIFDDVRHSQIELDAAGQELDADGFGMDSRTEEWLQTTCQDALNSVVSLFAKKESFGQLKFLLPVVFRLLEDCIVHPNQLLARKGVACLKILLVEAGTNFDHDTWDMTVNKVADMFAKTTPEQLMSAKADIEEEPEDAEDSIGARMIVHEDSTQDSLTFSPQRVLSMCFVQLDMVAVVNEIIEHHWDDMAISHYKSWLDMLKDVYSFARTFNDDLPLRVHLLNAGFMRRLQMSGHQRPPSLLNQETHAVAAYIRILIRMEANTNADKELEDVCGSVLNRYLKAAEVNTHAKDGDEMSAAELLSHTENVRMEHTFCPIIMNILEYWSNATTAVFTKHSVWLKPILFTMVMCDNVELRTKLQFVFQKHL